MGISARRESLVFPLVLQANGGTGDPMRTVLIAAGGTLLGWFLRSLLLSSFKKAVIDAVAGKLEERDKELEKRRAERDRVLDERLATRDGALDQRLEQMDRGIDLRFEGMYRELDKMAERRGLPRPHRDD